MWPVSEASISANIRDRAKDVPVDKALELTAADGTFETVRVQIGKGRKTLQGKMSADKTTWVSTQAFEPGVRYRVEAVAVDADGLPTESSSGVRTDDQALDEQTKPSLAPPAGETLGD